MPCRVVSCRVVHVRCIAWCLCVHYRPRPVEHLARKQRETAAVLFLGYACIRIFDIGVAISLRWVGRVCMSEREREREGEAIAGGQNGRI